MTAPTTRRRRLVLAWVILLACVGCDQTTKRIATQTLRHAGPQSYLGDTVRLQYALNSGAFLSLGQNLPRQVRFVMFAVLNALLLFVMAIFLLKKWDMPFVTFVSIALLLAGGLGNLIDRTTQHGLVTDFLNLGVGPLRTGIFNVADMAITLGGVALIWSTWARPSVTEDG